MNYSKSNTNKKVWAGFRFEMCIRDRLTGCAQTPESSLVKPKGNKAEDAYTEAEGVDMVKEDSSENTKDKNTAVRTTIRDPVSYTHLFWGMYQLDSDGPVLLLPDIDSDYLELQLYTREPYIDVYKRQVSGSPGRDF